MYRVTIVEYALYLYLTSGYYGCAIDMSTAVAGAMVQLAVHSWIAGSLFYLIGESYEIQGSRLSKVHTYTGRSTTAMLYILLANSV